MRGGHLSPWDPTCQLCAVLGMNPGLASILWMLGLSLHPEQLAGKLSIGVRAPHATPEEISACGGCSARAIGGHCETPLNSATKIPAACLSHMVPAPCTAADCRLDGARTTSAAADYGLDADQTPFTVGSSRSDAVQTPSIATGAANCHQTLPQPHPQQLNGLRYSPDPS